MKVSHSPFLYASRATRNWSPDCGWRGVLTYRGVGVYVAGRNAHSGVGPVKVGVAGPVAPISVGVAENVGEGPAVKAGLRRRFPCGTNLEPIYTSPHNSTPTSPSA